MHSGLKRCAGGDEEFDDEKPDALRRSTRQRFFNCRVCHGRVAGADRLNCAHPDCRACVHRHCVRIGSWVKQTDHQGGGWLCPVCGLEEEDEEEDNRAQTPARPVAQGLQQPILPQPHMQPLVQQPLPQQQQQQLLLQQQQLRLQPSVLQRILSGMLLNLCNFRMAKVAPMANETAVYGTRSNALQTQTVANSSAAEEAMKTAKVEQLISTIETSILDHIRTSHVGGSNAPSTSQALNNGSTPAKRMRPACPICCQPVEACGSTRPETCKHVFCYSCLMRWRNGSNSCPLDRLPFDAVLVTLWPELPPVRLTVPPVSELERQQQLAEDIVTFDVCTICRIPNRPGAEYNDMLICDHCEVTFHVQCLGPDKMHWLDNLEDGSDWLCPDCAKLNG